MSDPPPIVWMTYAVHEAYRRLGIHAQDIFIVSEAGQWGERVFVVARQGARVFAFDLGPRPMSVADFEHAWMDLKPRINDGSVSERQLKVWFSSWLAIVEGGAAGLVRAMQAKGFAIGGEGLN